MRLHREGQALVADAARADFALKQSRIHREPIRPAADARRPSEDRARDHLLLRDPHNPVRLDPLPLGSPVTSAGAFIALAIAVACAGPLSAKEHRSREVTRNSNAS